MWEAPSLNQDFRPGQGPVQPNTEAQTPGRTAYSDAYYRSAPAQGQAGYGYNPSRYYAQEEEPANRGPISMRAMLALCLACVLVAGVLGVGGLYLLSRDRRADRTASGSADFFAEARQALAEPGPLKLSPAAAAAPMTGEDLYAMACGQMAGVSGGSQAGSGIVLTADGYILTCYHIIRQCYTYGAPVTVTLHDGAAYTAQIVGTEADSDLAVLKIDALGLDAATLGDSEALAVGERVYAVGNPTPSLPYSITRGVVSAVDRAITLDDGVTADMFQFDAAIAAGSSGGPVYNDRGQVVGVATARYTASGVEGLGFAIPIADAVTVANELIQKGYVSGKAYLGIVMDATYTPAVARYYRGVPGAYVKSVEEGSAAQAGGLRPGDVITAVDGVSVDSSDALVSAVKGYSAGDSAVLTVWRGGGYADISVTFGEAVPSAPVQ